MGKTKVQEIVNNVIYVEPNYLNSVEQTDVNGLNTYEFAPPLEDYSIFVNLEVEIRGREVQSSKSAGNSTLVMSYQTSIDGKSTINFMQGSKIPLGDSDVTMNSLTTNYTDIFLKDLKEKGPTTEMFGISSIDISFNSYFTPQVTIEFVDVRGASLFARREAQDTNSNVDAAINSGNQNDIANTFFQCFFTYPFPKYRLLVKGFYGKPVSYELAYADFRARFDSNTGNFNCTAKFVGFQYSFLNDVTINGIVCAPYSDYIGSKYWEEREFKLKGVDGDLRPIPKLGKLLRQMKQIVTNAEKKSQSDPAVQEKILLEQKSSAYALVENAYMEYANAIKKSIKESTYEGEQILYTVNAKNGTLKGMVYLCPEDNNATFSEYVIDNSEESGGDITGKYEALMLRIDDYNKQFPDEQLPKPPNFLEKRPTRRIVNLQNDELRGAVATNFNKDVKEKFPELYNAFVIGVHNGNKQGKRNPLLDYRKGYFYHDNKFSETFEKYKEANSNEEEEVVKKLSNLANDEIAKELGFIPTIENVTKILMAHFETFAYMILKTAQDISGQEPPRTLMSLQVSDRRDLSDVPNPEVRVPPFPKVSKIVESEGTTTRQEAWVGEYNGDFREKDLVHGLINGAKEIAKDVNNYLNNTEGASGESGAEEDTPKSVTKYPTSPIDLATKGKPYANNILDSNDPATLLGLVGLRAMQIFGTTNFSDWGSNAESLGIAEAENLLADNVLSKEMKEKMSSIQPNDVIEMMKGNETDSIKKPGDGSKPWPWRVDAGNNGGIIDGNGNLIICKVKGNYFAIPFQNLSWSKIMSEVVHSPQGEKAVHSNDYINTYHKVAKTNVFSFDTNINKFKDIVEGQVTGIDGLDYYQKKMLDECKYDSSKYKDRYLNSDAKKVIAYIIDGADKIVPTEGSCMFPTSSKAFANKSFEHGYNMNYFNDEHPGNGGSGQLNVMGWYDKDGKEVKRIASNGFKNYIEELNSREFTFTEFPGVDTDLKANRDTSIFGQELYYLQKSNKSKALLFLASLGYAFDYKAAINDFMCNSSETMTVMPLPSLMFMGALLWAHTTKEGRASTMGFDLGARGFEYASELNKLGTLSPDVQKMLVKTFEKWVSSGIQGNSMLKSFDAIRSGLELHFTKRSPSEFFRNIGEIEDKGFLWKNTSWLKKFNGPNTKYETIIDLFRGEFDDNFFKNYITVDEDRGGSTSDHTRGIRLGNRDGGPSTLLATDFALAGCSFVKNSRFFNRSNENSVNVNPGTLSSFFKGFLDRIHEEPVEESSDINTQVSQAADPEVNDDIKIGVYRYCKLIYDKWIAGLTEDDFRKNWTMEAFFEDDDKYFYFIDSYYNKADFIPVNIADFLEKIASNWTVHQQYSLYSLLGDIQAHNKFLFFCVQNFADFGKLENLERVFDTVPYTEMEEFRRHPNFVVVYPYEASSWLDDVSNGEYNNDGFMINQPNSTTNKWPEPLTSANYNGGESYRIPAFGVSYGKMYQSYFKDIDVSMDNPVVTESVMQSIYDIASLNSEDNQTGDQSKLFVYGQDLYAVYGNYSYTCNVTMMGCAWIQPLMYFVLNNVPLFRGTYLIHNVTHHIEPGYMTTKFMGKRMSNICTRIAEHLSQRARFDQTGKGENNGNIIGIENNNASVNNDCEYQTFPLDAGSTTANSGGIEGLKKILIDVEGGWANVDGDKGGCTMAGVTIATYRENYGPNKTCKDLRNIPDAQWQHIARKFWDRWRADEINNKSIAYLLVDWTWTSGVYGLYYPQEVLGTKRSDPAKAADIKAINSYPNQRELFNKLWNRRKKHFIALSKQPKQSQFLKGWLNRLNHFKFSESVPTNKSSDSTANVKKGGVSELALGFVNALNQTADSSNSGAKAGIDESKSKGNTVYLTNINNSGSFGDMFDMMLQGYSDKIETIKWIVPGDGQNQSSTPAGYIVTVKEGSSSTKIIVVSEKNTDSPIGVVNVSKGEDSSGIHNSFCKALVKKYKSNTPELRSDTNNALSDYDALFGEKRYEIVSCGSSSNGSGDAGDSTAESVTNSGGGGKENETGYIGNWNVGKFVERLHYWRDHICGKPKKGGCGLCTSVPNRALQESGFGKKYWGHYPWDVYDKMKASNSDFTEVAHGVQSNLEGMKFPQTPQKGDVCTMWKSGRKGDTSTKTNHYHTCAYDGKNWISDFTQNNCNVYRNEKKYGRFSLEWHLFRHK